MPELYAIGEIAQRYQVTHRTLHYYEEIGLLNSERHHTSGARYYQSNELRRLEQILILRQLDFTINEIKDLLDPNATQAVKSKLQKKTDEIDKNIFALQNKKNLITGVLNQLEDQQQSPQVELQFLTQSFRLCCRDSTKNLVLHNEIQQDDEKNRYLREFKSFQNSRNTWPIQISCEEDIPEAYKHYFPYYGSTFPYTVLIPDENYSFFRQKGFMITIHENTLFILEKYGSKISSISFDRNEISDLSFGTELLNSTIEFSNERIQYSLSFCSVMNHLFVPILKYFSVTKDLGNQFELKSHQRVSPFI